MLWIWYQFGPIKREKHSFAKGQNKENSFIKCVIFNCSNTAMLLRLFNNTCYKILYVNGNGLYNLHCIWTSTSAGFQPLTVFTNRSILDPWHSSKYVSASLHFIALEVLPTIFKIVGIFFLNKIAENQAYVGIILIGKRKFSEKNVF